MKKLLHLIILIFALSIFTKTSFALFLDQEESKNNNLSASTLYFEILNSSDEIIQNPLFNISETKPGDIESKKLFIKKAGLENFKYKISYSGISGDEDFCNILILETKKNNVENYSDKLMDFDFESGLIDLSGEDEWEFRISFSETSEQYKNKSCSFKFNFKAWQQDSNGLWGLMDNTSFDNYVISGSWDTAETQTGSEIPGLTINSIPEPLNDELESQIQDEITPSPSPTLPNPEEAPELVTGLDLPEGLVESTSEAEDSE